MQGTWRLGNVISHFRFFFLIEYEFLGARIHSIAVGHFKWDYCEMGRAMATSDTIFIFAVGEIQREQLILLRVTARSCSLAHAQLMLAINFHYMDHPLNKL